MNAINDRDANCKRCGRTARCERPDWPPEGWEGTASEAVCPGCQFAEWHPHCMTLLNIEGEPVDPKVDWADMPEQEWDLDSLTRCEYIDLTVSWTEDADWPEGWTCPRCGGTEFEGVHRDYPPGGLQPSSFTVEADRIDD